MIKKLLTLIGILLISVNAYASTSTSTCYGTDTVAMLHMDGADTSTTFTDSSATALSHTANGNAQMDTAQSKFGGASGLFDGTGDYLSNTGSTAYRAGTGAFTVDLWVRFSGTPGGTVTVFDTGGDCGGGQGCLAVSVPSAFNALWVQLVSFSLNEHTFAWSPSADTWYHVAVIRSGTDVKAFIDGTQIGVTKTDGGDLNANGTSSFATNTDFPGWIDEGRFVVGTAVWTSDFTAPSSAYTDCDAVVATSGSGVGSVGSNPMLF